MQVDKFGVQDLGRAVQITESQQDRAASSTGTKLKACHPDGAAFVLSKVECEGKEPGKTYCSSICRSHGTILGRNG